MPPSSHYLNLLNLNQLEEPSQQIHYTNEDLEKDLEIFKNTTFLDFETLYPQAQDGQAYHEQFFDPAINDSLSYAMPSDKVKPTQHATLPRSQMPQFQPSPKQMTLPPGGVPSGEQDVESESVPRKRSADEAGHDHAPTPSSTSHIDEEDKRRRNTAASARFRIKKKQREQALLDSAKQMTEKNTALESRIKELEMENKWLRSLLKPVATESVKSPWQGM